MRGQWALLPVSCSLLLLGSSSSSPASSLLPVSCCLLLLGSTSCSPGSSPELEGSHSLQSLGRRGLGPEVVFSSPEVVFSSPEVVFSSRVGKIQLAAERGKRPGWGKTWKKKRKPRKKKQKRKPRKKKQSRKHPRNSLKFDPSCECGVSNVKRIVNGEDAAVGAFPWMVSLEDDSGNYYCGGSIISSRFIVTAAHCVTKGQQVIVHIGDHDKTTDSEAKSQKIKGKAKPHPRYNADNYDNDIAIVRLVEDIKFSDFSGTVAPVCLARKNSGDFDKAEVIAAGWGTISSGGSQATVLQEVTLTTISNKQCGTQYTYDESMISDQMLCTLEKKKDACQGDSGGPLVHWDSKRDKFVQIGVVSWGYGCAEPDAPGVFARVSKLERWVLKRARNAGKFCAE